MDSAYYLSLFLDEGRDKLHQVGHALTDLEHDPHDAEGIAHVFREIHSFKGNAETMGFTALASLAHAMEHVLDGLRQRALAAEPGHMRLLHRALLALEQALADVERGGDEAVPQALIAELEEVGAAYVPVALAMPMPAAATPEPATAAPGLSAGSRRLRLAITLDAHCLIRGTRAFMITTALEMEGAVLAITPSLEELDWPDAADTFEVLLLTDAGPEALVAALADIGEIAKVEVHEAEATSPPPPGPLALDAPARARLAAARQAGTPAYLLTVQLLPACRMPGARALLASQALAALAEVVALDPTPDALPPEAEGPLAFRLLVASAMPPDALRDAVGSVAEVLAVAVEAFDDGVREQIVPMAAPPEPAPRLPGIAAFPDPAADDEAGAPRRVGGRTLRIAADRYEEVLALAERLSEANARVARLAGLREQGEGPLADAAADAALLADALASELASFRRTPIEAVFNRYPRMVRELAHELGKQVSLQILGPELEIDRALADELSDLLVHLLRNAVDHGLEPPAERHAAGKQATGALQLGARREGGTLIITVADDGRGLTAARLREAAIAKGVLGRPEAERLDDEAALQLIFHPGFSTAAQVTNVSGRGVGLDAVKRKAEALGGRLAVESAAGRGTIFQLRFPVGRHEQGERRDERVGA